MKSPDTYIPDDIAQRINDAATLVDVASDFLPELKKKGKDYVGNCPLCLAQGKFYVTAGKEIFKCFISGCDAHGVGAATFLMRTQGWDYPTALRWLADRYHIEIPTLEERAKRTVNSRRETFRDLQLLESGIAPAEQKWQEKVGDAKMVERDRYEVGTLDPYGKVTTGDDMILNYLGLDGQPMWWKNKQGHSKPLIRARFQHPNLHLDKDGKPMKYKSPGGSPSALWLPQRLLKMYAGGEQFDTLFVSEGEKKADKMTLHGLPTCGLMGINNLNYEGMTSTFEQVIKKCGVKDVVFVVDSDWQELGKAEEVDYRPRSFFHAVKRFREYFYAYKNSGIELNIWFCAGTEPALKGMDDVLVRGLKGKEAELREDFDRARIDREGNGQHVKVLNITTVSDHKLLEMWNLQNTQEFIKAHLDALKTRKEFKIKGLRYRVNEEGAPEMVEKILPDETYWTEEKIELRNGRVKNELSFNYYNSLNFLRNRGYSLYEFARDQYRFVRVEGKVLKETTPHKIQQFVKTFTEELGRIDVLNMILRGGTQYLGPNNLSNLWYSQPQFLQPEKEKAVLIFKNGFWKITADGIEQHPLTDLDATIWDTKIIPFEPKYQGEPLVDVRRVKAADGMEKWQVKERKKQGTDGDASASDCEFYQFLLATSNFWWRKRYEQVKSPDGNMVWAEKENPENFTPQELDDMRTHLVCKMLAIGYTLHGWRDESQMKAVVAMDGQESEVGKSQGGTGKSIVATQFKNVFPTFVVDGKKPNLEEDKHAFEGADDRTGAVIFDDIRVNFNFEWLFSKITTGIEVNGKGLKAFRIEPVPIWVVTNHTLNGDGNSFTRRQYQIAFSDFFNGQRTPRDFFGHNMFREWEWEQWNLYYNFLACCLQTYLRYSDLNKYTIPKADIERRKLRQQIGENFLEFAEVYFGIEETSAANPFGPDADDGSKLNKAVSKTRILEDYLIQYKADKNYINSKRIKEKTELYCKYKGLKFNPVHGSDGRVKIGGIEYLIVANEEFDAANYAKIN